MPTDYKKELEEFSYIVSHDLNAPLRHIREFSKLLEKKLDGRLNEDEQEYFNYIKTAVYQAENMLEGLLKYSRLNTQDNVCTSINMAELVQDVVNLLKENIEETSAIVNVDIASVSCVGHRDQLKELLFYLLHNALKFSKPEQSPDIQISAQNKDDKVILCIQDKGIGLDLEQHERMFQMFKKLDPNASDAGVGIGLTLAKKIIERHDGDIWIEGERGEGVSVYFSLTKSDV